MLSHIVNLIKQLLVDQFSCPDAGSGPPTNRHLPIRIYWLCTDEPFQGRFDRVATGGTSLISTARRLN